MWATQRQSTRPPPSAVPPLDKHANHDSHDSAPATSERPGTHDNTQQYPWTDDCDVYDALMGTADNTWGEDDQGLPAAELHTTYIGCMGKHMGGEGLQQTTIAKRHKGKHTGGEGLQQTTIAKRATSLTEGNAWGHGAMNTNDTTVGRAGGRKAANTTDHTPGRRGVYMAELS